MYVPYLNYLKVFFPVAFWMKLPFTCEVLPIIVGTSFCCLTGGSDASYETSMKSNRKVAKDAKPFSNRNGRFEKTAIIFFSVILQNIILIT